MFNLMYFLISFFIGIVISLINIPQPKIIYMYPDINDNTIYTDNNNKKFKLISTEINTRG